MTSNKTKAMLQRGEAAIGTWCFLRDPGVVDVAGLAGFDFVVIDCEHSGKSIETIENMVRAAEAAGITPIVRVPEVDDKLILQVLETGAQGIMLPYIGSAEAAAAAKAAVRFPPEGSRGTCRVSRAANYGAQMSTMRDYMQRANHEILLIGSIEDMNGVRDIDNILDAGKFDVCVIGRGDLSTNLGAAGDTENPKVEAAVRQVASALKSHSCSAGIGSYNSK